MKGAPVHLPLMARVPGFQGSIDWDECAALLPPIEVDGRTAIRRSPAKVLFVDSFQISRLPVSNREFCAFLQDAGAIGRPLRNVVELRFWETQYETMLRNPDEPVTRVAWEEALQYCFWAGGRLPTDGEYQVAARYSLANVKDVKAWQATFMMEPGFRSREAGLVRNAPAGLFFQPGTHTLTPSCEYLPETCGDFEYVEKFAPTHSFLHPAFFQSAEVFRVRRNRADGWHYGRWDIGLRLVFEVGRA